MTDDPKMTAMLAQDTIGDCSGNLFIRRYDPFTLVASYWEVNGVSVSGAIFDAARELARTPATEKP